MLPLGVPVHRGSTSLRAPPCGGCHRRRRLVRHPAGRRRALALVAGDVVGNGASALAAAGQLRSAVLLAVSGTPTPAAFSRESPGTPRWCPSAPAPSICLAVVRPASGAFRYAVAGYPPPFVVDRTGATTPQAPTGDGRLGCTTTYVSGAGVLRDDEVLLVASDGFQLPAGRTLRRPRVTSTRGVPSCSTAWPPRRGSSTTPSCSACAAVPARAAGAALPALPDTVGVVRHEVAAWLRRAGVEPIDSSAVVQAVSELASNSVEHAYPAGTDHRRTEITVTAGLTTGCVVELDLRDNGRWRPPEPVAGRGRGPPMSREFVDDLRIDTGARRDRCRLRHRPSVDLRAQRATVGSGSGGGAALRLDVSDGHVGVRGAVGPSRGGRAQLVLGGSRPPGPGPRPSTSPR